MHSSSAQKHFGLNWESGQVLQSHQPDLSVCPDSTSADLNPDNDLAAGISAAQSYNLAARPCLAARALPAATAPPSDRFQHCRFAPPSMVPSWLEKNSERERRKRWAVPREDWRPE